MASDAGFVEFAVEQMGDAGSITHRKMFGEYAVYCDGKVVALICDNQLFVKQSKSGRAYIGSPTEASPYPGAKPYFLIEADLDDPEWISELIRRTTAELPAPKPKRPKSAKPEPGR